MLDNCERLIINTPLTPLDNVSTTTSVYLKLENLQPFACYKIRGLLPVFTNNLAYITQHGVAVASAGNMALATAFLAQRFKVACNIYIPESAPKVKAQALTQWQANITAWPFAKVWQLVNQTLSLDEPNYFIHPAYDTTLREGYGSIATEIIQQLPEVDAIVIPFGVGGLAWGITECARKLKPTIKIYLAEPATAAPFKASLLAKQPVTINRQASFIDAIGTPEVLPTVYENLAPLISDSLVVDLNQVQQALAYCYNEHKMIIEGAAACAVAAANELAKSSTHANIVCVVSGGNINLQDWYKIVAAAG